MNALDKMKADLARYHAALKDIAHGVYQVEPSVMAHRALNPPPPPPPPPVTLEQIQDALRERNKSTALGLHNITIFSDGSGHVSYDDGTGELFHFQSLQRALELLNND